MTTGLTFTPFDSPVDPGLSCGNNCGDPIVAVAVEDRYGDTYLWTHAHGSNMCRPSTAARPFDANVAHRKVWQARQAAWQSEELALAAAFGDVEVGS